MGEDSEMNAYDIAKDLDREGKFPGHVCYGTSPLLVRAANKLRKQADQITKLEEENTLLRQAMDNAFNGLESSIAMNKTQAERQAKELTDEEIIAVGNAVVNHIDSNEGWIEFARAILRKAQEK